jgi:hypothetical protein
VADKRGYRFSNGGWIDATFQGGTLSTALNEAPIVSLTSAAGLAIGAALANTIQVTGTTAITAFDTIAAGARRTLRFSDALTLTHNATSLILPRGANIVTVAGDAAVFVSLGGGNWVCVGYQRSTAAGARGDLSVDQVDNTSDANKPISSATQTALDAKVANSVLVNAGLANATPNYTAISCDNAPVGSTVRYEGTQSNATSLNYPTSSATSSAQVAFSVFTLGVPGSSARIVQIASEVFGSAGATTSGRGRTFVRVKHDSNWYGWREQVASDNPTFSGTMFFTGGTINVSPSTVVNSSLEFGYTGGTATTPYIDWHSGATPVDYDYRMIASGGNGTASNGTMNFRGAHLNVDNPLMTVTGEVRSTGINSYRQAAANYGTFWRNDNSNLYLMVTANGDPLGTFNSLRPFSMALPTGLVTIGNGLTVTGTLTANSGIVASQINSAGPSRVGQYTLSSLPSASAYSGYEIDVTDASGGPKRCRSNGTDWQILNTTTKVS